ncbi:ribonucleoprotein [Cordyceps fumosorosea ARSEF 2679]|uniref:Ribonucleoprotein n=1 Tax=Cordyceps fumosorosea (strain ARSEF 2679) TaxID=1081104 RepID=A0A167WJ19_CORFA|nr:ribonucleoprotein [Cordyceps fumosorosea ARSEF 2679]OAA63853.1 ribonucleoprotein [Cordyceps fumosorosea ARSEF 2679]
MEATSQQQQQEDVATSKRIYLGNLLYSVKPGTIEDMLHEGGFGNFEKIHISVDPVSGRNPGYCFVDFPDKASADRALETLDVSIGGRPLKVRPCEPKKPRASTGGARWGREGGNADSGSSSPARNNNRNDNGQGFNRWGDWNSNRDGQQQQQQQQQQRGGSDRNGPGAALNHFDENMQEEGRRLFVGGLGKMIDQEHNRVEMESIFAEFKPAAIGKRITARPDDSKPSGNRNFCFVDFDTREEAEAARLALDGIELNGSPITVRTARRQREQTMPSSYRHDIQRNGSGNGNNNGDAPAGGAQDSPSRGFASRDWRRRAD